jgi:type IV pilus assembly protein PilP
MISRRNSRLSGILLLAAFVSVAACKKDEKPASPPPNSAQQTVNKPASVQKQVTSGKGAPLKGVQGQSSSLKHQLPPGTVIDFSSRKDADGVNKVDALPIQNYDVNKFRLSGIVAGLKENRALIIDPLGKGYVVKAGMLIGNNKGRITKITNNAVDVLEQFRDENGVIRKRTVRLALPQKSKEMVR